MSDHAATSTSVLPPPGLRVLMRGVVDYAGLFPPASRRMTSAVAEYAEHRDGPYAWALSRFVLPAAGLEEFEEAAAALLPREGARSWALSALLGSDVEEDVGRIERFNSRHRDARAGAVLVDTVEVKVHSVRDMERAAELLDRRFATYMEVPVGDDPAELLSAISRTTARAKIRTGGVTPDAFPSSAQVIRFIARCLAHRVGFKATAGLHHAVRADYHLTYAPNAPEGTMFGFLNLLLAVACLGAGMPEATARAVLEERDPRRLQFGESGATWGDATLDLAALARARDCMATFGSCSFAEPIADLRALGFL